MSCVFYHNKKKSRNKDLDYFPRDRFHLTVFTEHSAREKCAISCVIIVKESELQPMAAAAGSSLKAGLLCWSAPKPSAYRHTGAPGRQGATLCSSGSGSIALSRARAPGQKASPSVFSSVLSRPFILETLDPEADGAGNSQQEQLGGSAKERKTDNEEVMSLRSASILLQTVPRLGIPLPDFILCLQLSSSTGAPATCS